MRARMSATAAMALSALFCVTADPARAQDCDRSFAEVFAEVETSVVQVFSVQIDPFDPVQRVKYGVGSGLIIDEAGHVVTNAHVVHLADEVAVMLGENTVLEARLLGSDPISDIAVLHLQAPTVPLKALPLTGSHDLEVGQEVIAIGHPYGISKSASRGIVSAFDIVVPMTALSWETPLILTDASINPGSSGGPLISRCGEVVGINSIRFMEGGGLGFAIPREAVRRFAEQIIQEGRVIRSWHGINGTMVPPQLQFVLGLPNGLMVEAVEPGSPAEQAGLHGGSLPVRIGLQDFVFGGEVILSVDETRLDTWENVSLVARSLAVGQEVTIQYWQDGVVKSVTTHLPERPVLEGDLRLLYSSLSRRGGGE
jgi:serine protease Do